MFINSLEKHKKEYTSIKAVCTPSGALIPNGQNDNENHYCNRNFDPSMPFMIHTENRAIFILWSIETEGHSDLLSQKI